RGRRAVLADVIERARDGNAIAELGDVREIATDLRVGIHAGLHMAIGLQEELLAERHRRVAALRVAHADRQLPRCAARQLREQARRLAFEYAARAFQLARRPDRLDHRTA